MSSIRDSDARCTEGRASYFKLIISSNSPLHFHTMLCVTSFMLHFDGHFYLFYLLGR